MDLLKIESSYTKRTVKLIISDNGQGIDKENLNKISDPFFTTKPVGTGTGLGLSITFKIIEDHGGTIKVSSTPKKGTSVTISFKKANIGQLKNIDLLRTSMRSVDYFIQKPINKIII